MAKPKSSRPDTTTNTQPFEEFNPMQSDNTAKSNTGTSGHVSTTPPSDETITIQGVVYKVIGREECHGRDIEPGTYTVVEFHGSRRAVIQGALRAFAPRGVNVIRCLQNATSGQASKGTVNELPERAVVLTPKAWAVMKSIAAVCGLEAADLIDEALPMIAEAQGINEVLYQRITDRALKASETPG